MARATVIGATPRIAIAPVTISPIARRRPIRPRVWPSIQHRRDTCGEIVTARHGEKGPSRVGWFPLRHGYEQGGVSPCIVLAQYGVVTRPLCFQSHSSPRGPDQRMEPVRRADHPRQAMRQKVPACNVLEFVPERTPERRLIPLLERLPAGRSLVSALRRSSGPSRLREARRQSAGARLALTQASAHSDCPSIHGRRTLAQTTHLPEADDNRHQEERDAYEPDGGDHLRDRHGLVQAPYLERSEGVLDPEGSAPALDSTAAISCVRGAGAVAAAGTVTATVGNTGPAPGMATSAANARANSRCRIDARVRRHRRERKNATPHTSVAFTIASDSEGHHWLFSFRARSISAASSSSSFSVHDPWRTSDTTICASDPPKKVCR